jgi:hypothetical protein
LTVNVQYESHTRAVGAAIRTLSAIGTVRRYKAWRAEWETKGEPLNVPPQPPKRPRRRWALDIVAALLFVGIPVILSQAQGFAGVIAGLTLLWGVIGFYLSFKVIRGIMRRMS